MAAAAPESERAHASNNKNSICTISHKDNEELPSQIREIIKPSINELTKEVRTNILCTVQGCGKILPNTPALNMHLVKSHRVKDGLVNPTVRKDMKGLPKLYCCPIEGCPRGPNRPFSQFSLVKQHFMKMHAEKKHKCAKCSNCYSTEWDLKRHAEDCGKTYHCTCGCPYASRAALLSHIYRTGHEVPTEHRYPPVKKRKMEKSLSGATKVRPNGQTYQMVKMEKDTSEVFISVDRVCHSDSGCQNNSPTENVQKPLLLKPKVALVNVPVMQFAHLPFFLSSTDNNTLRPVVLTVDSQGSLMSTVQLVPQSVGTVMPVLDTKTVTVRDSMPMFSMSPNPVSTGVQVNLDRVASGYTPVSDVGHRNKSTSTNIQTDISYLTKGPTPVASSTVGESSVSSCSQTDISVSAQVLLPVSVETQTFLSQSKITSSIGAQTDSFGQTDLPSYSVTRETQTNASFCTLEDRRQMDQTMMCAELFDNNSFSNSMEAGLKERPFQKDSVEGPLITGGSSVYDDKPVEVTCFGSQTEILHQNPVADNQTQTMTLFSDLENILSESMASNALDNHETLPDTTTTCEASLSSVQEQNTGIDFDLEEFLKAVHIQTQTEESELCTETPLESLDIETQTDFLLFDNPTHDRNTRVHPNDLGLEMFDTQTQTDLDFFLDTSSHMALGNFLKQSSFSISTESSDTETQTDIHHTLQSSDNDSHVKHNSTETQTVTSSFDSLGNLFLTSNQTQTVMDDFLMADLAWNTMESHFSSVETQTCEELFSLFQHSEKLNS
ncbi:ATM interactor [Megalops cyprinoides]|uniref:ATM interactor n=1 Tax=Megalops cyprinoides TaxID=118141 RepID=UPI001864C96D|nr:ATM interactor [Megalops cyprinoides]